MSLFTAVEWLQYQRHVQLNEVGVTGQLRLKHAKVVIVGAGGLGSPVAMYLGAAGVGHITIVDGDCISQTNLHRQVLFSFADIGKSKARVVAKRLNDNNPFITVLGVNESLSAANMHRLLNKADIVLDCTDNFAARMLINDHCLVQAIPWIYASVLGTNGQMALFTPDGPCFRCVFPEIPVDVPDCNAAGVLSTLPGMLGLLQANSCLQYLISEQCEITGKLYLFSGSANQLRTINLSKNTQCVCAEPKAKSPVGVRVRATPAKLKESEQASIDSTAACHQNIKLTPQTFVNLLLGHKTPFLLDVRSEQEHRGFNIGGVCISLSEDLLQQVTAECADRTAAIFVYCQSGKRSDQAVGLLSEAGYSELYSLEGGLSALLEERQLTKILSEFLASRA